MARTKVRAAAAEPVEGPWALPDGWRWERIEKVAPVNRGRSISELSDSTEIAFVGMAAVEALTGKIDASSMRPAGQIRQGFTRFGTGDVLFAKITPCMENGKVAIVPDIAHGVGCGSTEFHVLSPAEVTSKYLYYWVSQRSFRETAEFHMTGTAGQKRVPPDFVRDAPIPVPPLETQREIVARIEALLAEVEDGEAALTRARADLGIWRKALLKAAVTGELTADWRAERMKAEGPPPETGTDLLARILTERRTRWHAEPRNKGKRYIEPAAPDTDALAELPEGWAWATLGQVAFISGGVTIDAKRRPSAPVEVPYLRVANVQRGHLDLRTVKTVVLEEAAVAALVLQPGDILLNEGGDRDKIGRGWVFEGQIDRCVHQNHVFKARPATSIISPYLVSMYLNEFGRRFFIDEGKQTTNLASISLTKISRAPVPIPPSAETTAILSAINAEASVGMEESFDEIGGNGAILRQTILAAAFRGELAP